MNHDPMTADETNEIFELACHKDQYGTDRKELAALGERTVRDNLNNWMYGHPGEPSFAFVSAWLADAEFVRLRDEASSRDAREIKTLSIARKALWQARTANALAALAIIIAAIAIVRGSR